MRRLAILLTLTAFVACGPATMAAEKKHKKPHHIQWLTNLDEARQEAQRQGKPVFLDFFNPQ